MTLDKPTVCFDIEATGLDVAKDRIVQFAALRLAGEGMEPRSMSLKCDPQTIMSDEVIAVHGITNEEVACLPTFAAHAQRVYDFILNHDIVGFNCLNFDIPMLWEELNRAGIKWDTSKLRVFDVGNIFKKKEERTLSAGVAFYLGEGHEGAHDALADAMATTNIFWAQLKRYADLNAMTPAELAQFTRMDDRVDLAGKIVFNKDRVAVYNIGKAKGTPVVDDPGMAYWMLDRDFPEQTKQVLRELLEIVQEDEPLP